MCALRYLNIRFVFALVVILQIVCHYRHYYDYLTCLFSEVNATRGGEMLTEERRRVSAPRDAPSNKTTTNASRSKMNAGNKRAHMVLSHSLLVFAVGFLMFVMGQMAGNKCSDAGKLK